jgi:hypothetical protein
MRGWGRKVSDQMGDQRLRYGKQKPDFEMPQSMGGIERKAERALNIEFDSGESAILYQDIY